MKYFYLAVFLGLVYLVVMIVITGKEAIDCNETFVEDYNQIRFNSEYQGWGQDRKCMSSKNAVNQIVACYKNVRNQRGFFFLDIFDTNYAQKSIYDAQTRYKTDCPRY